MPEPCPISLSPLSSKRSPILWVSPKLDSTGANGYFPNASVLVAIRSISARSSLYSAFTEARSVSERVPFAACTANSRERCRMSLIPSSPPSAVCISEMPSLMPRVTVVLARTLDSMRLAIACPAASSLALLIRRPEESRSIAVFKLACVFLRLFCPPKAARLVLMAGIGNPSL